MNTNEHIIIPTPMRRIYIDGDFRKGAYEEYGDYTFDLDGALAYLSDNVYYLEDVILYNPCLRRILRQEGADALIEHLVATRPVSEALMRRMSGFACKWRGMQIGDFDIQWVPISARLNFGFIKDIRLRDIQTNVEASMLVRCFSEPEITHRTPANDQLHVGEVWAPYPVFDSYDAGDDRTYQNFIIRPQSISDEEMRRLALVRTASNDRRVHEDTPEDLLPAVFYKGDGGFMLVAAKAGTFGWTL